MTRIKACLAMLQIIGLLQVLPRLVKLPADSHEISELTSTTLHRSRKMQHDLLYLVAAPHGSTQCPYNMMVHNIRSCNSYVQACL